MSDILVIFAQYIEAEPFLNITSAKPVPGHYTESWSEGNIPSLYQFEQGWIAISGLGIHAAQMSVSKNSHLCEEVWNLGFAGSLNCNLSMGEIYSIHHVSKFIPIDSSLLDPLSLQCLKFSIPPFTLSEGAIKLVSSDFPIHNPLLNQQLAIHYDLVDMEGYGIAFACSRLGKTCRMWKIISDFASPGGRELIKKHKKELSFKLAQAALQQIPSVSKKNF